MNLILTNLSIQFATEWSGGTLSASFQQKVQGGRLTFSGSLNMPLSDIDEYEKLTITELTDVVAKLVLDKIENGEIVPETEDDNYSNGE